MKILHILLLVGFISCFIPLCSGITFQEEYASRVQNGDSYFGNNQFAMAKGAYLAAIQVNYGRNSNVFSPPFSETWYKIGLCEYYLANYDNAINSYNTAIDYNPDPILKNKILSAKAESLIYLNRLSEADLALTTAGMSEQDAKNKIAEILAKIGRQNAPTPTQVVTTIPPSQIPTPVPVITTNAATTINNSGISGSQNPVKSGQPETNYSILVIITILTVIGVTIIGILLYKKMHKNNAPDTRKKRPEKDDYLGTSVLPDLSDKYTESEFIGKGGFARVFKAKRKDGQYVAVKIPISMDASTGKSFIAEMQNWIKLSHPNIVRLFDFNIMPVPYFEEELCDRALSDLKKPLECEEAAWILFNVCEGLKFAHARKIIHRDLKPQNILMKNGVPKISDWGLSRIISESTTTTATSFTPYYAAPEQINKRVKDERTDIWQIGVILYELVTGVLPFTGDSMVEIGMNIATKDPIPPGELKPDAKVMDAVVMKCLEKDPKNRYQSVLELQKDLGIYLRKNYAELLKTSVTVKDYNRSAYYCGDLVMINLLTGDISTACKYLLDLVSYSKGDLKVEAQELSEQIKMRMEMGLTEIPDELIQKAEIIVHQVNVGFRNKG